LIGKRERENERKREREKERESKGREATTDLTGGNITSVKRFKSNPARPSLS
jgi:hypothetical protein